MSQTSFTPLFGSSISTALSRASHTTPSGFTVPAILARLWQEMENKGLHMEGIFRKSGSTAAMNKLQAQFEENHQPFTVQIPQNLSIHAFAGLFKRYLQQLSEPVIPRKYQHLFTSVFADREKFTKETIKRKLKDACKELPHEHLHLLQYLIEICRLVSRQQGSNHMNIENLSIIFAPTCVGITSGYHSEPNSQNTSPALSRKPLPIKSAVFTKNARKFFVNIIKKTQQNKLLQHNPQTPEELLNSQLIKESNTWIHIFEFMLTYPEVFASITNPLNSQKYQDPKHMSINVDSIPFILEPPTHLTSRIAIDLELHDVDDEPNYDISKGFVDFSVLDRHGRLDFSKTFDDFLPPHYKLSQFAGIKPLIQKFENMKAVP